MKKICSIIAVICLMFFVLGARLPPPEVSPISYNNVIYYAGFSNGYYYISPKTGKFFETNLPAGGYVEAYDAKTQQLLSATLIYKIIYNPIMETDVQNVYIKNLALQNNKIIITDELKRVYILDLNTGLVKVKGSGQT